MPVAVRVGYVKQRGVDDVQAIGGNVLIDVPKEGDFKWASPPATAFEPTERELSMLERQMASIGLAFLQSETRAAETAEAKRLDTAAQNATLATAANGLQDAAELPLEFHAAYRNQDGGSLEVARAYEATVMDPRMLDALSQLEVRGQLDLETLLRAIKSGGVLPEDAEVEEIMARLVLGGTRRAPDAAANGDEGTVADRAAGTSQDAAGDTMPSTDTGDA